MAGYDDNATIAQVLRAMAQDPRLSRRQAIIQSAGGDESLRRIEMKMKVAEDEAGDGVPLRRAIAELHAEDHPMWMEREGATHAFHFQGPTPESTGSVGFVTDADGKVMDVAERRSVMAMEARRPQARDGELATFVARPVSDDDVLITFADLGLIPMAVSGVLRPTSNDVVRDFGASLARRWQAHGFHEADHMNEAVALETARMEASGLAEVRSRIGADRLHVMGTLEGNATIWSLGGRGAFGLSPDRVKVLARAGGLARQVGKVAIADLAEELRKCMLFHSVEDGLSLRKPTEDEIGVVIDTFSDRALAPVSRTVIDNVFSHLTDIDFTRLGDPASKAALVGFMSSVDLGTGILALLNRFADAGRPYGETLSFTVSMSAGAMRLRTAEFSELLKVAGEHVLGERFDDFVDFPGEPYSSRRQVMALVETTLVSRLTAEAAMDLGMAWREAGRPGQAVPTKGVPRRLVGPTAKDGNRFQSLHDFLAAHGHRLPSLPTASAKSGALVDAVVPKAVTTAPVITVTVRAMRPLTYRCVGLFASGCAVGALGAWTWLHP